MRRSGASIAFIVVFALLVMTICAPAIAAPHAAPDVTVSIDELPLPFDAPLQREEYRVLVPFRAISEAIGVKVDWVAAEKGIIATRPASADGPAIEVRLWIDRQTALLNGVEQSLDVPPRLVDSKTFIPARFFATAFGCGVDWDEAAQRVLIATPERTMTVYGFYGLAVGTVSSWADLFGLPYPNVAAGAAPARLFSSVGYAWYSVDANGRLRSDGAISGWSRPDGWDNALLEADRAGLTDEMVIHANGTESKLAALLADSQKMAELRAAIVAAANDYNGVNLDWESFSGGLDAAGQAAVKANYAAFVSALAADLHAAGKTLTVTVQPGNNVYAPGFDYQALGAAADRIVLMAYDYYDRSQPSAMAPIAKVEDAIKLLLEQQVPASKMLLGMAPGGVEWVTLPTQSTANQLPNSDVTSYKSRYTTTWDENAQANWLSFQGADGRTFKVWIEDGQSISRKIALAKRYGLQGIAVWHLGGGIPSDVWRAIDESTKPGRTAADTSIPSQPEQP